MQKKQNKIDARYVLKLLLAYAGNDVPISQQLYCVRTLLKKSQFSLAQAIHSDQATVSEFESRKRNMGLKMVEKYCQALGLRMVLIPKNCIVPIRDFLNHEGKA